MKFSTNNPYNDYSIYLNDITKNADEYFNEKICTEYQLKHNFHMINEQVSFYRWEYDMRKSYVKTYLQKDKHLLSRVIIDMTFAITMTAWFIYLLHFIAMVGLGFFGVVIELIYIVIGIIPAMSYGLSTLLEYLTTKELSCAVRISRFLGRSIPGNELKDLHIELAELERKIITLEDFRETLYNKVQPLLEKPKPFFMDRDEPFISHNYEEYRLKFFKLTTEIENAVTQRKNLTKERDDLLFQHKFIKEKTITYVIITILVYILYFTVYYSVSESVSFIVSIGGFLFALLPMIISTSKLLFQFYSKEEFLRAMDIQKRIDSLMTEEYNLKSEREKLEH